MCVSLTPPFFLSLLLNMSLDGWVYFGKTKGGMYVTSLTGYACVSVYGMSDITGLSPLEANILSLR